MASQYTRRTRTRAPRGTETTATPQIFRSRAFGIVLMALLIALSISVTREGIKRFQLAREIREMSEQIAVLEERNAQMVGLTKILNTSAAQEKQSRITLNMAAPGEQVLVLKTENRNAQEISDSVVLPNGEKVDTVPEQTASENIKKWMQYFVKNNH